MILDDTQLQRYSRQILLPEIDTPGQQRLLEATVLIVGAGGLGSPAAMYLASSGVGRLVISDHDRVESSNLQRQILHGEADLDRPKAESAADRLRDLNSAVAVEAVGRRLEGKALDERLQRADVVLDGSDNFPTRFALNAACSAARVPLVSGAVIRFQGQATVFRHDRPESPCLRCLYPEQADAQAAEGCAEAGILAPVAGIIGSVMAVEALKLLIGFGTTLEGRLLRLDAETMEWRTSRLARDPACPVCAGRTDA